jgi:ribonuclease HI|tara:strand:+ start:135 stop:602 length:468 start_codon:yes stop_codon:yes gene_type:complete
MSDVIIYTDGSAKGNPGNGGYGAVLLFKEHEKRLSQGYLMTTNNRMELLAVIIALESLKRACDVMIYSDSKYVIDSVEKKWVFGWQKKGFKGKKNPDLWLRFLEIYKNHKVQFTWVKGHAGNKYNEICDILAVNAAESSNLIHDTVYEMTITNKK